MNCTRPGAASCLDHVEILYFDRLCPLRIIPNMGFLNNPNIKKVVYIYCRYDMCGSRPRWGVAHPGVALQYRLLTLIYQTPFAMEYSILTPCP